MGYERNDRRYGYTGDRYGGASPYGERDRSFNQSSDDRARAYGDYGNYGGSSASRDYRGDRFNDRGSDRYRSGRDDQDRGFFDRAGDEVRSWFGDEEAERRRREDDRLSERSESRGSYGYQDRGTGSLGGDYRSRHEHDPHYRSWRDRQLESLDRDYDEYRQQHQSKFDSEFGSWRQGRQGQRELLNKVEEHFEVVGSDGQHIGTVDHVRDDRILLTKSDQASGGRHHSIPSSWIQSVDDKVIVSKTADQAKQHWRDEERSSNGGNGLFGRDDDRNTNLDRSFSGTYRI